MKILTFILACYVLVLSAIPCCAMDCCGERQTYTKTVTAHQQDSPDDGCKNCSPFSICKNCTGFTNTATPPVIEWLKTLTLQETSDFIPLYFPQHTVSFWQPPKIG